MPLGAQNYYATMNELIGVNHALIEKFDEDIFNSTQTR